MTVDKIDLFGSDKKKGQRELPPVELTKELLDSVRHIEGFPIGTDEDIIKLSAPPYYTACPNPFIGEFIKKHGKPYDPETDDYQREPFAADVSEGKTDPIYNAHTYHTKVPHKAIMRYILHYTEPGDLVYDGFCGTGMTGVAAQLCGERKTVESLGYRVKADGTILEEISQGDKVAWQSISKLGPRKAILSDLSPAASFITHNYNVMVEPNLFEKTAQSILLDVGNECEWMYSSLKPAYQSRSDEMAARLKAMRSLEEGRLLIEENAKMFGITEYAIWSNILVCPQCSQEVNLWRVSADVPNSTVIVKPECPFCKAELNKKNSDRAWVSVYDSVTQGHIRQARQDPTLIIIRDGERRHPKTADSFDMAMQEFLQATPTIFPYPHNRMPAGDESRRNDPAGFTCVHHFFTPRNLHVLSTLNGRMRDHKQLSRELLFILTSFIIKTGSKLHNVGLKNATINLAGAVPNTLYMPGFYAERNIITLARKKLGDVSKVHRLPKVAGAVMTSTQSLTNIHLPEECLDYIFIDPPFGSNLMYSELNFLWESWLGVTTNSMQEAIQNNTQSKGLNEYHNLMERCFRECYRVLKPKRWITVEFHNSSDKVWNAILLSLQSSGFVVAGVGTIDKQQGTYVQMTTAGAVKTDLVITAYKPSKATEQDFAALSGTPAGVWLFLKEHLGHLPVTSAKKGALKLNPERQHYLLYDRMIAFHIERGCTVPMSASEFYLGLKQRFVERDGMYFLPEQATEYDKARSQVLKIEQLSIFVTDEKSAILWVRSELEQSSQTYGELMPNFMRNGQPQRHEKMPDLQKILEQNFLKDEAGFWRVPDINRQADLEKLREKDLLREFEEYRDTKGKIKVFRTEAVRAGFKLAWGARNYATIVAVAKKLPEAVLQEDQALLMYYDNARIRLED
ncbi:MAG: hypothetical protein FD169_627 [Bacillota bacterium]|nr:MAG: hypothetical protein FD169_627 [Bacillota bacterium]